MFPPSNAAGTLDRRFLRCVLELALGEARNSQKDYLDAPHLFLALMKLDSGCTQDALHHMGFSPRQVGDTFHLALGSGKATATTPILPTRRCKRRLSPLIIRWSVDAGVRPGCSIFVSPIQTISTFQHSSLPHWKR